MCRTVANCLRVDNLKKATNLCWTFQTWLSESSGQATQILKAKHEWSFANRANGVFFLEVYLNSGLPLLIESQILASDLQLGGLSAADVRVSLEDELLADMPPLSGSLPAVVERYLEEETLTSLLDMARRFGPDCSTASIGDATREFDRKFGSLIPRYASA